MSHPIRAAVVQAAPVAFDTDASLAEVERLTQATPAGTDLIVFPEAFVSGYPKHHDFGARVGTRSDDGRRWFERYYASAIDVPGPAVERLGAAAAGRGADMVVGVIERDGGTLYCTALFLGRDGRLLGKHRKLVPTAAERLIWGRGDGSTLPVIDTAAGKVGAVICWENYMPLLRATMYDRGVELYCAPTVDDRDSWQFTMRHIAVEGRCFVLSACQYAEGRHYPADYPADLGAGDVVIRGGSCIVDPFGTVLAGPVYGEEAILSAELDRRAIVRGKYDLDVSGHYARPDVFRLDVDGGDA